MFTVVLGVRLPVLSDYVSGLCQKKTLKKYSSELRDGFVFNIILIFTDQHGLLAPQQQILCVKTCRSFWGFQSES